jgi:D-beta-D-heptose 7-phosphate kinase/D-beta-D-heptose 1-phosphate adenosyltransferase
MLDKFLYCESMRDSPEFPAPILTPIKQDLVLGGAANVAKNIISLGANVLLVGVIGKDKDAVSLKNLLKAEGLNDNFLISSKAETTTSKKRIICNNIQLARIDNEKSVYLDRHLQALKSIISENINKVDGVIISDYNKGVINCDISKFTIEIAHKKKKVIFVDPKKNNFDIYQGAQYITPNLNEIKIVIKNDSNNFNIIEEKTKKLCNDINSNILITKSENGLSLVKMNGDVINIEGEKISNPDVTGAGDTVIASFALSILNENSEKESAKFANQAASKVVQKNATSTVSIKEIIKCTD